MDPAIQPDVAVATASMDTIVAPEWNVGLARLKEALEREQRLRRRAECTAHVHTDAVQLALDLLVREPDVSGFFRGFNRGFDHLSHGYGNAANFVIRHSLVMLLIYVALIGSAGWLLVTTPQGFIPAQDRGYVIVSVQLPGAASLARTTDVVRQIEKIALDTPGIVRVAAFAGFSGAFITITP